MAAAAAVSVSMGVIKSFLAKLSALMADEYKKLDGLPKEVYFLRRELDEMDVLLEKMDSADELDPQAKNWRKDIIDMSYDIEDYIDDFMRHVGEANEKKGILQKASQYLRSFKNHHHLANQFQEIKTRVIEASERRKRYMIDQSITITAPVAVDPRLSAIYKESASLVGINTQKTELVNWAMDKGKQLKVMAIVGFGGLGKTTLANEVYREVGVKFECKAFVSVSQKPEIIGLFNSLLLQIGLDTYSHTCQVQDPVNNIRGYLRDKRYFIIVDDLWDKRAWDTIQCAFPKNNQCSRVVITTRNENLARSCCSNHGCIHNMKHLSEQDSRQLFFDRIFGSEDACPSELKKASFEILKKCGGLPLAIITMASMLACQSTRVNGQYWEYIKKSLASKFAINSNYEDMMCILDLSYNNLPSHLKACFLYLGSYPEDYEINRVELVRRWVAEGFVGGSVREDIWDVGESYFNELVNRSMIQPIYDKFIFGIYGCRVHDMLLELIVRRCKEDNFLSLVNDSQVVVEVQDKVIRRLNIAGLRGKEEATNLAHIRSFTILGESNWIPSLLDFKFVRVLSLRIPWWRQMETDLTVINQLLQLRYLKVEGDGKSITLPNKIQGLRLLETLDFSDILNCNISLEIVDVLRLSHLIMPVGTILPDWIGKVRSLRTLRGFSLVMNSLESITSMGELIALSDLDLYFSKQCLRLSNATTWMTSLSTCLDKLGDLKQLRVGHSYVSDYPVALCTDALSSLSPPFHNLEMLDLQFGCTFSRAPRWIGHLENLRDLSLGAKQVLQEDVAIIGTRLPSLFHLRLRIPGVPLGTIVIGGSMGFPALNCFRFDCDRMSFLTFEAGAMLALRKLELILDANKWDKVAPTGLQHLLGLEKIIARMACYNTGVRGRRIHYASEEKLSAAEAQIRGVFQEAIDALPTRPAIT